MFSRALPRLITPIRSSFVPMCTRTFATRMSMSMSGQDIISLIKQDHAKVNSLYEQYKSTSDINMKKSIAHQMIKEIVVHAGSEEVVLYPVVKELLGTDLRDHAIEEHSTVERGLYELENNLKVGDAEFDRVLSQTMKDLNHHVQEEETNLLPKCAAKMDQERLMKLGSEFLATKKHAPHRPHPMAPKTGLAGKLAKAAAKPMDDMTDPLEGKQ